MSPKDAFPKAQVAFSRALQIDPNGSLSHRGLAWIEFQFNWDWDAVDSRFNTFFNLDPNEPRNNRAYAYFLLSANRIAEAVEQMKITLKLDPLSRVFSVNYGQFLTIAGKYDEAINQLKKTIQQDPKY